MKRPLLAATVMMSFVALGWWTAIGQSQPTDDVRPFMQLKLDHAQKVLEGIAVEDFTAIARHAQEISLLTQEQHWMVYQTPEYRRLSMDFRRIADELTNEARRKNLDGAALAYVQMTLSCVNCHKYTRGVRMAKADLSPLLPPADPAQ